MKKYRAILFDLFGTVALFNRDKLPLFEWEGQTSRSTMGALRAVYEQKVPTIPFPRFFAALSTVSQELGEERVRSLREFPSVHRFTCALVRAGLSDTGETQQLAAELTLAHMALLANATEVPAAHADFLSKVSQHYGMALVSNFDHAPTARQVLRVGRVEEFFQSIVISDEHGWRKPHPQIFTDTLMALGTGPEEALFVGDSPHDDIIGAKKVGMDIAWVNLPASPLPVDSPTPEYTVRSIPELLHVLFS